MAFRLKPGEYFTGIVRKPESVTERVVVARSTRAAVVKLTVIEAGSLNWDWLIELRRETDSADMPYEVVAQWSSLVGELPPTERAPQSPVNLYTVNEATHHLHCKHCQGRSVVHYRMKCVLLGEVKSGKAKVLVFGERNWRDREHIKRVRYVDAEQLSPMAAIVPTCAANAAR